MPTLHTVYTVSDQSYDFQFITLPFLLAGIGMLFYYIRLKGDWGDDEFRDTKTRGIMVGSVFTILPIIINIASVNLGEYDATMRLYKAHEYKTVEGRVSNYVPMPYEGHQNEEFDVDSVHFSFSDYTAGTYEYHNAASHGGAIRLNLYVRIGYYYDGFNNRIWKLETE